MAPHSSPSPRRRPLLQPVEQTATTNRASPTKDGSSEASGSKPRKVLPQPVETSISLSHSRQSINDGSSRDNRQNAITSNERALPQPMAFHPPSQKARRFAPQMIDTTRCSRRNTDTSPCVVLADKTDESHRPQDYLPQHMRQHRPIATPIPPDNSSVVSSDQVPQVPKSKVSSSKLAEKAERRHSFRVPDLPAITSQSETEESNDSSVPSLSTSPSADSDQTELSKTGKKRRKSKAQRESQDMKWSGYLLSLAAKTAEKQLRDQAMAAYPNEHLHEPVDHYAIDRDSEGSDVEVGVGKLQVDGPAEEEADRKADRKPAGHRHRDSDAGLGMAEMRKHHDKLGQQKQGESAKGAAIGRRRSTRSALREAQQNAAQKPSEMAGAPPKDMMGWQKDNDIKPMQKAASPPMAGQNLRFPKCQSPRATRLDVFQYPGMKKSTGTETRQHTGLWTPRGGASRQNSKSGLWMGVCNASNQDGLAAPKTLPTGLLTPAVEHGDPMADVVGYAKFDQLPPSPPSSQEGWQSECQKLDNILRRERSIDEELNDTFVTQVYNYLSLGYPSLARKFDDELAKITKVSIEDLRKDDHGCNAKGYVDAPEGTGSDPRGLMDGDTKCERWCALREYVREWGRQQPGMGAIQEVEGGWGARARKDSWAI